MDDAAAGNGGRNGSGRKSGRAPRLSALPASSADDPLTLQCLRDAVAGPFAETQKKINDMIPSRGGQIAKHSLNARARKDAERTLEEQLQAIVSLSTTLERVDQQLTSFKLIKTWSVPENVGRSIELLSRRAALRHHQERGRAPRRSPARIGRPAPWRVGVLLQAQSSSSMRTAR